jgi:hypothetical protein
MDSVASLAEAASRSGETRLAILRFDTNACLNNMSTRPQRERIHKYLFRHLFFNMKRSKIQTNYT